jgi:hypothetical protein
VYESSRTLRAHVAIEARRAGPSTGQASGSGTGQGSTLTFDEMLNHVNVDCGAIAPIRPRDATRAVRRKVKLGVAEAERVARRPKEKLDEEDAGMKSKPQR